MANKFIYFVLTIIVVYSRSIETYFLNDDLGTNLPDRFGDPIEENWQDKRSAVNEYSSSSKKHDNFPNINRESTDLDYRNGNAEIQVDDEVEQSETLQKRESEMDRSVDEVKQYQLQRKRISFKNLFQPLNEADIRQILSQFSRSDREALDSLMNDESPNIDVDKRQLLKRNFENNYHLNKRNNYNVHCKGVNCEESNQSPVSSEFISEDDSYNRCPGTNQTSNISKSKN